MVKGLPAMQQTWVPSLDWDDPLEKAMATHFSILAWRIPWTEYPGGLQSMGLQRVRYSWVTNTDTYTYTHTHTHTHDWVMSIDTHTHTHSLLTTGEPCSFKWINKRTQHWHTAQMSAPHVLYSRRPRVSAKLHWHGKDNRCCCDFCWENRKEKARCMYLLT